MDATSLEWWEVAIRIVGAAVLGGLIGIEREVDGQDAGFRTHLLLAVGAAVFGTVSVGAFDDFVAVRAASNVQIDVTRIASYVAAGIGFIGGGAILKSGGTVKGLTTAASLWTAAAVGLAAGLGFWSGALAATIAALVALSALKPVSTILRRRFVRTNTVVVTMTPDADLPAVLGEVRALTGKLVKQMVVGSEADGGQLEIQFWSRLEPDLTHRLLDRIGRRDDVTAIRIEG
jgi:putative Mg2+ transporter-C (MgtC) family protein